ncbi:MAG: glycosyltransferase [Hyphomonas sp.]|nr:glycosyltransferase [Hyphomonas sp.]
MFSGSDFFSGIRVRERACRPSISVVMTVRERFGTFKKSLESLYQSMPDVCFLIVVTGGAPAGIQAWLTAEAERRGFLYVNQPSFLTPAQARNIGCSLTHTEYVAFVENDVSCQPGWLDQMLECALETGAGVVCPVICEGADQKTIRHAGAVAPGDILVDIPSERRLVFGQEDFFKGLPLEEVRPLLFRRRILSAEMHCFLARREILNRANGFDPDIVFGEAIDFSWNIRQSGTDIWLEPGTFVTYLAPGRSDPVARQDRAYFRRRWSKRWRKKSLDQMAENWTFDMSGLKGAWGRYARERIVTLIGSRIPFYPAYRSLKASLPKPAGLEDYFLRALLRVLETLDNGPRRRRKKRRQA